MADIVDAKTRSRMMSGIRAKNTLPELQIRRSLFARGFRYRLHAKQLPGRPDIVLPKYKAVVFVHGCFWHRHDCKLFKWPESNAAFWKKKIDRNWVVDRQAQEKLTANGWRVAVIWECSLRGALARPQRVTDELERWLKARKSRPSIEIQGKDGLI